MNKNGSDKESKDVILSFIAKNGVFDKDARENNSKTGKKNCRKHNVRVVLDLHGMKCDDAARKVRSFLTNKRERGIREILIIHGRGNHSNYQVKPVLKTMVHDLLEAELHHLVRDFKTAAPRDGGEGATLVYLK